MPLVLENQQLKLKLDASIQDGSIIIDRLAEYMLLLRDAKARLSLAEAKCSELERLKSAETDKLHQLSKETNALRETNERCRAEADGFRKDLEQIKVSTLALPQNFNRRGGSVYVKSITGATQIGTECPPIALDLEFKVCPVSAYGDGFTDQ